MLLSDTYWAWSSWSLAFKSELDSWASLLLSWASSVFRVSTCCCRSYEHTHTHIYKPLTHHANEWAQTVLEQWIVQTYLHCLLSLWFFVHCWLQTFLNWSNFLILLLNPDQIRKLKYFTIRTQEIVFCFWENSQWAAHKLGHLDKASCTQDAERASV